MKKIAVIVALDAEYNLVQKAMEGRPEVILAKCGIGKVNAAIGATAIIERHAPEAVISTGVAGSLSPELKTLDVIAARRVAYHDVWCGPGTEPGYVQGLPQYYEAGSELLSAALSLKLPGVNIKSGLQISGDRFIVAEDISVLHKMYPEAVSVDMESGALSQTCYRYGIPFLSLRVVSDSADSASYTDFWGQATHESFKVVTALIDSLLQK